MLLPYHPPVLLIMAQQVLRSIVKAIKGSIASMYDTNSSGPQKALPRLCRSASVVYIDGGIGDNIGVVVPFI